MRSLQLSALLCFFVCVHGKTIADDGNVDDYYWRDYKDFVPKDAFVAGFDRNRKPIYIGQAVYSGALVPGQFAADEKRLYIEWDYMQRSTTQNIKILCTKHPLQFDWIKTDQFTVKEISKRRRPIIGGFRTDEEIFIGRGTIDGDIVVGKVVIPDNYLKPYFKVASKGMSQSLPQFEILSYSVRNPDSKSLSGPSTYQSKSFGIAGVTLAALLFLL